MNAIRILETIDSDTLHIPDSKDMIGRTVEIIVLEEPMLAGVRGQAEDWDTVLAAVQQLQDYDYQAQVDQDACDIRDAMAR